MKRKAYTLAETLIALGIIGVVSAMVIPTLVTGHMKQVYAQRLATAVTDFENAMSTMIIAEGVDDLLDTEAWQVMKNGELYAFDKRSASPNEKKELQAKLGKYLVLVDYRDSSATIYRGLDSDGFINNTTDAIHYKTKKGIEYLFIVAAVSKESALARSEAQAIAAGCNYKNRAARIYIDVNGAEGPNRIGRDLFGYDLSVDGKLYADGSPDYNFFRNANSVDVEEECVTNRNGLYCAEYLAKNGYKMDY